MARRYSRTELGTGYGLVAGAAVGVLLLAATGSAVWLGVCAAIGLVAGAAWGQLSDERSRTHRRPPETSHTSDGPGAS